jgi:hypothetical protein
MILTAKGAKRSQQTPLRSPKTGTLATKKHTTMAAAAHVAGARMAAKKKRKKERKKGKRGKKRNPLLYSTVQGGQMSYSMWSTHNEVECSRIKRTEPTLEKGDTQICVLMIFIMLL